METRLGERSAPTATASTGITEPTGRASGCTDLRTIKPAPETSGLAMGVARSGLDPDQLGYASGYIPVGHVNIGILIDVASVGRAKVGGSNIAGKQLVVRPLV